MGKIIKTVLTLALVTGLISACTSNPAARLSSAEQYSKKVQLQLDDGDLRAAESTFGEMELYYPYAVATRMMQLKMIGAYYQAAEMDRTVVAANQYVARFSSAEDIDQAYYYSGMANYDRGLKYLSDSAHEKSPLHAKVARESFMALLRCCFESRYVTEASERMVYLDESLAQYEFELMRAELLQGNRIAAVTKGNSIIENYPTTNAAGVAEVVLSVMDKPEILDSLLIATALTINQEAAEAIVARAGEMAAAPVIAAVDEPTDSEVLAPASLEPVAPGMVAEQAPVVATTVAEMVQPVGEDDSSEVVVAAKLTVSTARYTVQMGSSHSLAILKRYIKRLGLADVVNYEPRIVNGEQWYAAYYGAYDGKSMAQRDADQLMARVGVKDLWVRKLTNAVAEPHTVMAASETIKARPSDVKARAVGRYAIQVASDQDINSLKADVLSMKLDGKVEYYRRVVDNRAVYSALYGGYADVHSARAELSELEGRINKNGLWIRAVDESQKLTAE